MPFLQQARNDSNDVLGQAFVPMPRRQHGTGKVGGGDAGSLLGLLVLHAVALPLLFSTYLSSALTNFSDQPKPSPGPRGARCRRLVAHAAAAPPRRADAEDAEDVEDAEAAGQSDASAPLGFCRQPRRLVRCVSRWGLSPAEEF